MDFTLVHLPGAVGTALWQNLGFNSSVGAHSFNISSDSNGLFMEDIRLGFNLGSREIFLFELPISMTAVNPEPGRIMSRACVTRDALVSCRRSYPACQNRRQPHNQCPRRATIDQKRSIPLRPKKGRHRPSRLHPAYGRRTTPI